MISSLIAAGVLASIVGYASLWGGFVRQPFAASLTSVCCLIVCALFVAALFGVLYPMQVIVFFGGGAALLKSWRRSRPMEIGRSLLEPAPVIFFVTFVGFFIVTRDMLLIYWDEFALWATNSKYLLTTDQLPIIPGAVRLYEYPPGDALFQYFVARLIGFSEGNLIWAHAVFQTAALLPILAAIRWRDSVLVGSLILIGWVAGYFFGESNLTNWTSIIVDNDVGYLFAAAFAIYLGGGCSLRAVICAMPVVAALTLIKQIGFLFALIFAFIVLTDKAATFSWSGLSKARLNVGAAAVCLTLFAMPIALIEFWYAHLRGSNVPLMYTWQKVYDRIAASDFGPSAVTIVSNVVELVKGHVAISAGGFGFPAWISALALLAVGSIVAQDTAEHRLRISTGHIVMAGSLVLYLAFLLALDLFALYPYPSGPLQSPSGVLQLTDFARYLGSFLLAWMGIGLACLVHEWRPGSRRLFVVPFVALLACVAVYVTREQAIPGLIQGPRADPGSKDLLQMRKSVRERLGLYGDVIPLGSRVYSVWNGTTGLPFYMSVMELKPRPTNARCFSVGNARFNGDIWSCDLSVARFREVLNSYDFLLVGRADDNFWDRYEELFAPGARPSSAAFFKIDKSGQYLLNPISVPEAKPDT
jgi:hypothetical protein